MNRNSVLLGVIKLWLMNLYKVYEESFAYRILHRIYLFFSNAWASSLLIGWLSRTLGQGKGLFWSFYAGLFSLPQRIGKTLKIEKLVRGSGIARKAYALLMGVLNCNTRLLGAMLFSFSLGTVAGTAVFDGRGSFYWVVPLLFGAVLFVFQRNLTQEIAGSKVIRFILDSFALDVSFTVNALPKTEVTGAVLVGLLGGVLFGINPLWGIAAVVGVLGMLAVLYRPYVGVVVAVIAAPFIPTMMLAGLVLFTLLSLLFYSMTHAEFKWRLDWAGAAIIAFLLVTWLSMLSSYAPGNSIMVGAITTVFVLFYFCVVNTACTKKQVLLLLKLFVISGFAVALYGVLQYVMGWGTNVVNTWLDEEMFENVKLRVYSTLENPNVLGEYLLLVGFVCGGLMCTVKREWQKIMYGGMLAVIFACLILTQSRGCWLGCMLGLALLITITNGRLWGLFPIGLAALPFVIPQTIVERFSSIGNLEDSSSSYRVFIWLGTIRMLQDFWISGVGMGEMAYNNVYPYYSYNAIVAPHSHNLYLQLMVHSGISALLLFLGIVWMVMRYLVTTYRKQGKWSEWGLLCAAVGCGILAYLFQGVFDYVFYNYRVMLIFWSVLGMAVALYHSSMQDKKEETDDQRIAGIQ